MLKNKFIFLIVLVLYLVIIPKKALAQVVINKFSSATNDDDWVEIYNVGSPTDISQYSLVDSTGSNQKVFPECVLNTNGAYVLGWQNRLNNGGDTLGLINASGLVDCVSYGTGPACDGKIIDFASLGPNEFGIRQPAGTGGWTKTTDSTKSENGDCLAVENSPTLTLQPSPTPTPFSTLKINPVHNSDGVTLDGVKVYVDGSYIHHETPTVNQLTLTFCQGCTCYEGVECDFGEHVISLEKNNYSDWAESNNFSAGTSFVVNPVMDLAPTSTPTPTPSLTPTPTPTPTKILSPTPTKVPSATPTDFFYPTSIPTSSVQVLGEQAKVNLGAVDQTQESSASGVNENSSGGITGAIPYVFVGAGLILTIGAGVGFFIQKKA